MANAAGVSKMTASRALREHSDVAGTTRDRIRSLAQEMGYVPNKMAAMLSARSSPIIPMIIPSLSNIVFMDIVESAQAVFQDAGYQMMLVNTDYSIEKEQNAIESLLAWSPAALMVTGIEHTAHTMALLEKAHFPTIEMMDIQKRPIGISVGFDHFKAGEAMGRYLIEKGYRNIAFCGHRLHLDRRASKRLSGFKSALREAEHIDPVVVNSDSGYGIMSEDELAELTSPEKSIDCVYFSNDDLAVAALLMCQRRGMSIPDDLAIAGFNDILIGQQITPRLTTTRTPRRLIGAKSAECAISAIRDEYIDGKVFDLKPEIIPRESA